MATATWGKHSNETYLDGIKKGDRAVIHSIFTEFQPNIIKHLMSVGACREEAQDIFADAIEVIYRKVQADELVLTVPFSAYLLKICQYTWRKIFRKKSRTTEVTEKIERVSMDESDLPDEQIVKTQLHKRLREAVKKLTEDCQQIIRMRWDKRSYADIAAVLGHGSEGYSRRRKHICQERLIKLIKEDTFIQELYQ